MFASWRESKCDRYGVVREVLAMVIKGMRLEEVRQRVGELTPAEQAQLMLELERGLLLGQDMPAVYEVMDELRREIRKSGVKPVRLGSPSRWFFMPLEPFIVGGAPERGHRGRIARASLMPIWIWICRDLMPVEAKAYSDKATRALLADDMSGCQRHARAFQDRAITFIQEAITDDERQEKTRLRLAAHGGPARAIGDLHDIVGVLRARDTLAALGLRLPAKIDNLDGEQLDKVMTLLNPLIDEPGDVALYALILVMGRLATHWHLIRLAIKAAQSNVAARVEKTPYTLAVALVLAEIDDMISARQAKLMNGETTEVGDLLKHIHEATDGVRTELDLAKHPTWDVESLKLLVPNGA